MTEEFQPLPDTGTFVASDVVSTPGTWPTTDRSRSKRAARSSGATASGSIRRSATTTRRLSSPSGRDARRVNVPTSRPASTTSASDIAIWPSTSVCPSAWPPSPATVRDCSFMAAPGSTRVALSAGRIANNGVTMHATPIANSVRRQSRATSSITGVVLVDSCATISLAVTTASSRPAATPRSDNTTLSASSCRTSRQRDPPMASRTLISARRPSPARAAGSRRWRT